jgi:hypothetical protein
MLARAAPAGVGVGSSAWYVISAVAAVLVELGG